MEYEYELHMIRYGAYFLMLIQWSHYNYKSTDFYRKKIVTYKFSAILSGLK